MNKIIYVKYSELTLKKKNRMDFIRCLFNNIKFALNDYNVKIVYYYDYITISDFNDNDLDTIFNYLKNIPGINSYCIAHVIEKDLNILLDFVLQLCQANIQNKQIKTFRITCKRQDKTFTESQEIISNIAGAILKNTDLKVSLNDFDWNLQIEVKNDYILVFDQKENGINGLPVGSSGKAIVLLSGGIDSPVAARLLMNRGLKVDFLTFITPPHTSEQALEKVRLLAKTITMGNKICQSKLYICNFTNMLHELSHISKQSYRITLMRRRFFVIAKLLAQKNKIKMIATGESLGQVASQTIESMEVINESVDNFLVIRPLIIFDKNQIINEAKKYNTYDISILPYDDSCSLFAPKNPITKPLLKHVKKLESSITILNELTKQILDNKITEENYKDGKYR